MSSVASMSLTRNSSWLLVMDNLFGVYCGGGDNSIIRREQFILHRYSKTDSIPGYYLFC